MELIPVKGKTASDYAGAAHANLVGKRFRFEPTPNDLTEGLEKAYASGELEAARKILNYVEKDDSLDRDDIIAALHLYNMDANNFMVDRFGEGKRIEDVTHFTDKYISQQQENFH